MKRRSIFQPLKKGGNPFLPLKEELQVIKWENEQLGLIFQDVEADQWMGDDGPYILTPVSPQGQLEAFLINTGARISVLTQDAEKQGMRSIWQTAEASSMNCTSVVCKIAKGSLRLPNVRHMAIAHFTIKDHYENILGFCFKWTNLAHGDRHCMFLQLRQKEGICFMATTHSPCTTWHKNYTVSNLLWHELEFLKSQLVWRKDNHLRNHFQLSHLSGHFDHQGDWAIDNTAPLTAAVPKIANLISILQAAEHPWMGRVQYKSPLKG